MSLRLVGLNLERTTPENYSDTVGSGTITSFQINHMKLFSHWKQTGISGSFSGLANSKVHNDK